MSTFGQFLEHNYDSPSPALVESSAGQSTALGNEMAALAREQFEWGKTRTAEKENERAVAFVRAVGCEINEETDLCFVFVCTPERMRYRKVKAH